MAYDKIITVHTRLDKCIRYVCNNDKTVLPSGVVLQDAINCLLETAYADMTATKKRWDKTGGVLGYHIIHSFRPGEVTPEQAQALGVEFASRLLGDRFEAVVTTHTDHEHLHCHIVFNSVSFVDGRRYRNDFKAYFGDIRGISNEVSRENGLSVIEPKGRGQHYAEWNAEQNGKTTVRGLIRRDIDAAVADAFTLQSFFAILEKRSYAVKRGPNIARLAKHETVFSAMSAADAAQLITEDVYCGEPTVFHVRGYSVVVLDEALGQALTYLIRPLREVILLRFFCDKSIDQIAALVNLSPTTVRYRCQKAMERLKNILQDIEK